MSKSVLLSTLVFVGLAIQGPKVESAAPQAQQDTQALATYQPKVTVSVKKLRSPSKKDKIIQLTALTTISRNDLKKFGIPSRNDIQVESYRILKNGTAKKKIYGIINVKNKKMSVKERNKTGKIIRTTKVFAFIHKCHLAALDTYMQNELNKPVKHK